MLVAAANRTHAPPFNFQARSLFSFALPRPRNRMNVHFFRHGAAISNDSRLTEAEIAEERFLDAPLSDHGREQARLAGEDLARALQATTVDVVLVSPLCRALETAELILSSAGISPPVRVIELLREAHGVRRCDARRPRSVAAARFPSFVESIFQRLKPRTTRGISGV